MFASSQGNFYSYNISQSDVLRNYTLFSYTNISVISSASLDSMEFVSNYPSLKIVDLLKITFNFSFP